jgi:RNA polymerase sigma-70 factor (ECF subfamily)
MAHGGVSVHSSRRAAATEPGRGEPELDRLAREAARGTPGALAALLEVLNPLLVRYCRAVVGHSGGAYLVADAVAKDACHTVLQALPGHVAANRSALALAYVIVTGAVSDAMLAAPDRTPDHADPGTRMSRLLATLPPLQGEILTLRAVVGLSVQETAAALVLPRARVRTEEHRALVSLRGALVADDLPHPP